MRREGRAETALKHSAADASLPPRFRPLRHEAAFERPEDDESATAQALLQTLRRISQTPWQQGGHALRRRHGVRPWNRILAHRPLGWVMRVRQRASAMSARFRSEHSRQAVTEPRSADDLPA